MRPKLILFVLMLAMLEMSACGQETAEGVLPNLERLSLQESAEQVIPWWEARNHIGEVIVVEGPVVSAKYASNSNGQPTFLNIGMPYPDPGRFTALIWGSERDNFVENYPPGPETYFLNKKVRVRGLIEEYKGTLEVVLYYPDDIWVVP